MKRLAAIAGLGLLGVSLAAAQAVYIAAAAEKVIFEVGESVKLTATGRDPQGEATPLNNVVWRTRNPAVLRVSAAGVVTAIAPGVAVIGVAAGEVRGEVELQAVPKRIEVRGPRGPLVEGRSYPFQALALDVNDQPIPNVRLEWVVEAVDGYRTDIATIDAAGGLTALNWGAARVEAVLSFPNGGGRFIEELRGGLRIQIERRRELDFVPLVSSGDPHRARAVRAGLEGSLAANDAGQLAFAGSLDGVAGGILVDDNGVLKIAVAGGTPTPLPGGILSRFEAPSLNNRGRLAVGVAGGGRGGLLYGPAERPSFVVLENAELGGFGSLCCFKTYRDSLRKDDEVLFSAGFEDRAAGSEGEGLFAYLTAGKRVRVLWDTRRTLEDGSRVKTFIDAGIADDGTVYFVADYDDDQAVYRLDPRARRPVRLARVGDVVFGGPIVGFWSLTVGRNGDAGWGAWIFNQPAAVFHHVAGETRPLAVGGGRSVLGVHRDHGIVYAAETFPDPLAVYRWKGGEPERLLAVGEPLADGSVAGDFASGAVTGGGKIFVRAATSRSSFAVIEVTGGNRAVVADGDPASVTSNVFLQEGALAQAPGGGDPVVLLGDPVSLFRVSERGLEPLLVVGDRLPSGHTYSGPTGFPRVHVSDSGEPYFSICGVGPHRVRNGVVENLLGGPDVELNGLATTLACNAAVSPSGRFLVFDAWTDEPDTRLYVRGPGGVETVAILRSADQTTVLPGGGRLLGWGHIAVDDRGRVMASLEIDGGPGGLYVWENGQWRATLLQGQSVIRGGVVEGIYGPLAAAAGFHAILRAGCCDITYGEYSDGVWRSLLEPSAARPPGEDEVGLGAAFDVNRRGDILFLLYGRFGQALAIHSGGVTRLVVDQLSLMEEGVIIEQFGALDLRDDGTFYFQAVDADDAATLYHAVPRGQGPSLPRPQPLRPLRSRSAP